MTFNVCSKRCSWLIFPGVAILFLIVATEARAQTAAFTYQGRLQDGGTSANGNYDLQFTLWDAASGGTQQPQPSPITVTRTSVAVANGIFTVQLNFGAGVFPGADRFLEIGVRLAGGGPFTILSPRQQTTATPYAIRSANATTADSATTATTATNATQLNGVAASQYVVTGDSRLTDSRAPTAGSVNYVQNQTSSPQSASFNISGNGTAGATLSGNVVNAATQYNIGGVRFAIESALEGNTFVGSFAGVGNTTGIFNAFFGPFAGNNNSTGAFNSFFGVDAGVSNTTGSRNSFFGSEVGFRNTTGQQNSFFGRTAGFSNTTGIDNTMIGYAADVSSSDLNNATAIGFNTKVSQSNSLILGAGVNVGIGTGAPQSRLTVQGGGICAGPICNPANLEGRVLASGSGGEFSFLDRGTTSYVDSPINGERWLWYGIGGRARLWSGSDKLSLDPSGNMRVAGTVSSSTTPDIAETIATDPTVTTADVVCADPLYRERAIRCSKNDRAILGVISDGTGGFLINSNAKSTDAPLTGKPLVLAGRVPVKVSLENGPIQIGDFLSPSSTPGVAMRAGDFGPTIGIALEAFSEEKTQARNKQRMGTVLCFVKAGEGNTKAALERINQTLMRTNNDSKRVTDENRRLQQENASLKVRLDRLEQQQSGSKQQKNQIEILKKLVCRDHRKEEICRRSN